ncbi:MAG: hypothetical protein JW754_00930 [Candidatus Aenigmarchaeota archaeon]|nr:hypothetical protein [Candidatus Aenigmarchaeota archaeon]
MDLLSLTKGILENHGIKPNTELDQHFMVNENVLEKIVKEADIKTGENVLEIGPGTGNLTRLLSKEKGNVTIIETDKVLFTLLQTWFSGKKIHLINGNGLEYVRKNDFDKLVSNIPYAICEPLIKELVKKDFGKAVLTIPSRFFARLTERGTMLSLITRCFFSAELVCSVGRDDFYPQPETDSVVVSIRKLDLDDYREKPLEFLFREIMLQRTKKLGNALMEAIINLKMFQGSPTTKRKARSAIKTMGIKRSLSEKKVRDMDHWDFELLEKKLDFVF